MELIMSFFDNYKMRKIKWNLILFIIFGNASILCQENVSINGFVRDDSSGEPISYANVFLSNTSMGAATNNEGYFVLSNIPSGLYEINVAMIGYAVHKEKVDLSFGKSTRLEIRLT